jgi:hypothetical protein
MPWKENPVPNAAWNVKKLSPAMKVALKALILGAAKTNVEAGKLSGLHPAYIGSMKNTPLGKGYMSAQEDMVDEKLVDTSALMTMLGREALNKMAGLMRFSPNEHIVLRAASDLMDRAPETQKVTRIQAESFTIASEDAKGIAAAMVEAARQRTQFDHLKRGDFVRIADVPAPKEDAA